MQQTRVMHEIAASYDAMADLYVERFGDVELQHPLDRATLAGFAGLVRRDSGTARPRVADLGCGPGHWTAALAEHDLDVVGIDASSGLLAHARRRHPHLAFFQGDLARLDLGDADLDGAVAWFSLIHTPPEALHTQLDEITRVLRPGGLLLVGFQASTELAPEAFEHRVTRAWSWPVDAMAERLAVAGLVEVARGVRQAEGGERMPGGHLVARRDA